MTKKKVHAELCFSYANFETDWINNRLYAAEMQRSQENPVS